MAGQAKEDANASVDPAEFAVPRHVAIIMDGNGRWAKKRLMPRVEGHRVGAKSVRAVVEESRRRGVQYLTLFAFSSENWQRPKEEVSSLMKLFQRYLKSEIKLLCDNGVRLRAIGDLERLPEALQDTLRETQALTADLDGMQLILAVSYGGRGDLVQSRAATGSQP